MSFLFFASLIKSIGSKLIGFLFFFQGCDSERYSSTLFSMLIYALSAHSSGTNKKIKQIFYSSPTESIHTVQLLNQTDCRQISGEEKNRNISTRKIVKTKKPNLISYGSGKKILAHSSMHIFHGMSGYMRVSGALCICVVYIRMYDIAKTCNFSNYIRAHTALIGEHGL